MSARRRRVAWAVLAGAVALVAVVVLVVVRFVTSDAPDVVDAGRALDQDRAGTPRFGIGEAPAEGPTEAPPTTAEELSGRWVVDTSRPFDGAEGRGTFVGYRVDEELASVGATTAIGRSPEVEGHLEFDGTRVVEAEVTADLTALESDEGARDRQVRSMLGADTTARFVLDDSIDLGEVPRVGEVIEMTVAGTLAIRDVEHPVEVGLQAVIANDALLVTGSTVILLEDYDVEVPSVARVLSASDEAVLEWQLYFRRP